MSPFPPDSPFHPIKVQCPPFHPQDNQQTVTDVAKFSDSNGDGSADTKAKIINHLTYNAFGRVIATDNPQTTISTTDGVLPGLATAGSPQQSYTGQLFDSATGLLYYDARWFDPFTNQFVSEDPSGFAAGDTNLRRYVGNSNPNGRDPSGRKDVLLVNGSVVDDATFGGQAAIREIGLLIPPGSVVAIPSPFFPPSDEEVELRDRISRLREAKRKASERLKKIALIADDSELSKNLDYCREGQIPLTANHRKLFYQGGGIIESENLELQAAALNTAGDIIETPIHVMTCLPGGGVAKVGVYYVYGEDQDFLTSYCQVVGSVAPFAFSKIHSSGSIGLVDDIELLRARAARDMLAADLAPLKGKGPATVTAGYSRLTGRVAAHSSGGGLCAEDYVVIILGEEKGSIRFTEAIRPRTGVEVPVCPRCEGNYGRLPFPPGTRFKTDE